MTTAKFHAFLEGAMPNKSDRSKLFVWMHDVITQQEPLDYALLIVGEQGTGKTFIGRVMSKVIGEYKCVYSHRGFIYTTLSDGWRWATNKHLICVDLDDVKAKHARLGAVKALLANTFKVHSRSGASKVSKRTANILITSSKVGTGALENNDRELLILRLRECPDAGSVAAAWEWTQDPANITALAQELRGGELK